MPIVFCLSLVLLDAYTGGDQVVYRALYQALGESTLEEMPYVLLTIASSAEPLTGLILWAGANLGIEKVVFISSLNVVLVAGLFVLVRRHKAPWPIVFLLLTNFYLLVLLTAAERLKIAYIFLTFSAVFAGKTRLVLSFASPFAHLQSLILLSGIFTGFMDRTIKNVFFRLRVSKGELLFLVASIAIGLVVVSVLSAGVLRKATIYMEHDRAYTDLVKVALLLVASLLVTRHRLRMVLALLPILVAVSLLGGSQVNMIAFVVVFFLLLIERRLNHPIVYALMAFLSLKSIPYVYNIFEYGDGFVHPPRFLGWALQISQAMFLD